MKKFILVGLMVVGYFYVIHSDQVTKKQFLKEQVIEIRKDLESNAKNNNTDPEQTLYWERKLSEYESELETTFNDSR